MLFVLPCIHLKKKMGYLLGRKFKIQKSFDQVNIDAFTREKKVIPVKECERLRFQPKH